MFNYLIIFQNVDMALARGSMQELEEMRKLPGLAFSYCILIFHLPETLG